MRNLEWEFGELLFSRRFGVGGGISEALHDDNYNCINLFSIVCFCDC